MRPVLTETFLRGSASCRPLIARTSLAEALVDPALDLLSSNGAEVRFGCRVRVLVTADRRVTGLETDDGPVSVEQDDAVIIAAPPWTAETLVPSLEVPPAGEAIVNVHFRLPPGGNRDHVRIVGIVGGLAQWIFQRHDIVSVTISAADRIAEESAESIAARCWKDAALALNAPSLPEPPSRVIKEKRATFAQTPQAIARRPGSKTDIANLLLAGDWTATGLPATIESAVRSGVRAAEIAAAHGRAGRARAA